MDSFLIKSANGLASLEFFGRVPTDTTRPIEEFSVKVVDQNLCASATVWAGYSLRCSHPVPIFGDLARQWKGWQGAMIWKSLEGEFGLECENDRRGHIRVSVELRPGFDKWDWLVRCAVMIEAGQLDAIAQQAVMFFGEPY